MRMQSDICLRVRVCFCVSQLALFVGVFCVAGQGGMLALETPDSRSLGISIVAPSPCLQYLEQVAQNINMCSSVHDPDNCITDASVSLLEEVKQLRASYGGRKVIVGVDRCSRLSGVTLKLLAYETLTYQFQLHPFQLGKKG